MALPMLTEPGFREEDFTRLKDAQLTALKSDLRTDNEEELGKERLQQDVFAGTPYGHPALGTVAGIGAITLDDVKAFVKAAYNRANLTVGVSGDVPDELVARLKTELAALPVGPAMPAPSGVVGRRPQGPRGRDRREGDPRHGRLLRLPDRGHALAPRLRGSRRGPGVARRAPRVVGAPLPAHPRGAWDELRRLRLRRGLPPGDVPVLSRSQHRAPRAALRGVAAPPADPGRRPHGAPDRDPRARRPRRRTASHRRPSTRRGTTS